MKFLKKIGKWILIIFVIVNLVLIIFGQTYLYKAVANTYLKGRSGPSIAEYKIFANRAVKSGPYQKWNNSFFYNSKLLPTTTEQSFTQLETVAFVVVKNDSLIHEQYWDGFNADSYSNSFSMAKSFVSILVGIAIDEGKIKSVEQPVSDFLPEFKTGKNALLRIKHLLTMSSGINFDEDYVNPFAYPAKAYYGNDLSKLTYSYKVTKEPGKEFEYLSGNTELLSFILEKATGQTLSDYASLKLWKPLGAKNSAFWSLDHKNGNEKAYCCFNSNAPDFARIGQLYLDSGKWNGQQLVPLQYFIASTTAADLVDGGKKNNHYGYSWWLIPTYRDHQIYYARGILGQYIVCIPDLKMVIVRLGEKRLENNADDHPMDVFLYIDAALDMYGKINP